MCNLPRHPLCQELLPPNSSVHEPIFCFATVIPHSREEALLPTARSVLAECDGFAIYSNTSIVAGTRVMRAIRHPMVRKQLTKFGTALNAPIFDDALRHIARAFKVPNCSHYAWYVRVDVDSVFFPQRLRESLTRHQLVGINEMALAPNTTYGLAGPILPVSRAALAKFAEQGEGCHRASRLTRFSDDFWLQQCFELIQIPIIRVPELLQIVEDVAGCGLASLDVHLPPTRMVAFHSKLVNGSGVTKNETDHTACRRLAQGEAAGALWPRPAEITHSHRQTHTHPRH